MGPICIDNGKEVERVLQIAVGITSEQKLVYLKELIEQLDFKVEIIPIATRSGVSDQPLTIAETIQGATNRAGSALTKLNQTHFTRTTTQIGIGIEVGYQKDHNGMFQMYCAVMIMDDTRRVYKGLSSGFLLPAYFQDKLEQGQQLGAYTDEYLTQAQTSQALWIAKVIKNRQPMIRQALENSIYDYLLNHQ